MDKLIYLILLSAVALAGLGITRATADPTAQDDAQPAAAISTGRSAARVHIDPETRKAGGPPPGIDPPGLSIAEQNKLSRSEQGLEKRQLPDGTLLVNLQGRFQNMSVVSKTHDGKTHISCNHAVDDVEHKLLHGSGDPP
jgi:hypothetical protein